MSSYSVEAVLKATGADDFAKAFKDAEDAMSGFESVSKGMKDVGSTLTKRVTAPLLALGGSAIYVGSQYETSMSKVEAISGATAEEMEELESVARQMGATTVFSASQAADGLGYMALAGWDTEAMIAALPSVLDLAVAGQMDLANASDIVTDMMSMFGMEAEEAARMTDVFAAAQANSNTDVEQLGEALKNTGAMAASMGHDIEETSAILGILADNGIKGSRAGTALNAVYRDLAASAEDGAIAIGDMSVAVYDQDGNMRSIRDIIADVEEATADMTDEQRNAALAGVFQQQSLSGVNTLLNAGTEDLYDLTDALYDSEGAASDMAETMGDNTAGGLKELQSAFEEVLLVVYEEIKPMFDQLVEWATDFLTWLGELNPQIIRWAVVIGIVAAAIGPLLVLVGTLLGVLPAIAKGLAIVTTGLKILGLGFLAPTAPILALIAAIGLVVAAVVYLWKTNEDFRNFFVNLWEGVSEFWSSIFEYMATVGAFIWTSIKNLIGNVLEDIWGTISGVLIGIEKFWNKHGETILALVTFVFQFLGTIIGGAMAIILGVIGLGLNAISILWDIGWGFISTAVDLTFTTILGLLDVFLSILEGDWAGAWETIKETAVKIGEDIWENITGVFTSIGDTISDVFGWIADSLGLSRSEFAEELGGMELEFEATTKNIEEISDVDLSGLTEGAEEASLGVGNAMAGMVSNITTETENMTGDAISKFAEMKEGSVTELDGLGTDVFEIFSSMNEDASGQTSAMHDNIETDLNNVVGLEEIVDGMAFDVPDMFETMNLGSSEEVEELEQSARGEFEKMPEFSTNVSELDDEVTSLFEGMNTDSSAEVESMVSEILEHGLEIPEFADNVDGMDEDVISTFETMNADSVSQIEEMSNSIDIEFGDIAGYSSDIDELEAEVTDAFETLNIESVGEVESMSTNIEADIESMTDDVETNVSALMTSFESDFAAMESNSTSKVESMTSSIKTDFSGMKTHVDSDLNTTSETVRRLFNNMDANASSSAARLVRNVTNSMQNMQRQISSITAQTVSTMRSYYSAFNSAGFYLMSGFISGMNSRRGSVMGTAASIANSAANAIRSALRIMSPSRVLMGLGVDTILGFEKGIESEEDNVINQMARMASNLQDAFTPNIMADISARLGSASNLPINHNHMVNAATPSRPIVNVSMDINGTEYRTFVSDIADEITRQNNTRF